MVFERSEQRPWWSSKDQIEWTRDDGIVVQVAQGTAMMGGDHWPVESVDKALSDADRRLPMPMPPLAPGQKWWDPGTGQSWTVVEAKPENQGEWRVFSAPSVQMVGTFDEASIRETGWRLVGGPGAPWGP